VSLSGFLSRIEKKFRKLKLISVKSRGLNAKALVIRRTRIVDLQLVSIFFVNYTIVHYFYQTPLASLSMKFVCDSYYLDRFLRYLRSKSNLSEIEMTMGIRFPMGMGIPRESHGNGNWWQNWEWEWEGMGNNLYGNGNGPYSNGNKFPLADAVFGLCNSNIQFTV